MSSFTPEMKHFDLIQSIALTSSGAFSTNPLNAMVRGDTNATRDGNRIRIKKIGMRLQYLDTASTDDGDVIRIIVLVDHQANGANPAVTDVLQSADVQAFRAAKTMKRFTFLFDRYIAWQPQTLDVAGTGFAAHRGAITWFKDLDLDVEFRANSADIAGVSTNAIHLFAISQQASDTTITWTSRVSFVDY